MVTVIKHLAARVACLIVLPVMAYLLFFGIHFQALPSSGPGDGFFSSSFQSTLTGNQLHNAELPGELAYGAVVTIKNNRPAGTLLHSHQHLYPKEHKPEQGQITGYSHKDVNNDWRVNKVAAISSDEDELEYVRDGDIVRLQHVMTKRNLHSHNEKAPLTTNLLQVSGYGENGMGDANDFWRVKVVMNHGKDGKISTVKTVFKLIHVNTGCALAETDKTLPKWGWEQKEMACNPITHMPGTTWNVEGNVHKQVPKVSGDILGPTFLQSVYESHIVMAQTNNNFKPKEGEFTSQAWHWPINYRGQVFSGGDHRVYLLGNPIVWWLVLATFFVYGIFFLIFSILQKRGYPINTAYQVDCQSMLTSCGWLFLGWLLHYFPFYAMGRVLYFHHYFPAYLFSCMFAGILLEHACKSSTLFLKEEDMRIKVYYSLVALLVAISILSFYMFRGLSYGMSGPMGNQHNATQAAYRWLETWDV